MEYIKVSTAWLPTLCLCGHKPLHNPIKVCQKEEDTILRPMMLKPLNATFRGFAMFHPEINWAVSGEAIMWFGAYKQALSTFMGIILKSFSNNPWTSPRAGL